MILITLLGQTCSGKSELAIHLANEIGDAWIVNCDSRQIYKKLNLGTGKVEGQWISDVYYYKNVKHFLIDYVYPEKSFGLMDYLQDFTNLAKTPNPPKYFILVGGTGLYAKAVSENYELGKIKPEFEEKYTDFKNKLGLFSLRELQFFYNQKIQESQLFLGLNKKTQSLNILNESDYANPRRLINWILRQKTDQEKWFEPIKYAEFEKVLSLAITADQDELKIKIKKRLEARIDAGLVSEVKELMYLGRDRLFQLGLEYKYTYQYLVDELSEESWKTKLITENYRYAKRQLTWLKKQDLFWINSVDDVLNLLDQK